MKRLLIALLLAVCFLSQSVHADTALQTYTYSYDTTVNGTDSTNASLTAIASPGANLSIKIIRLKLNVQTADTITVKFGSLVADTEYFAANGGVIYDYNSHPYPVPLNTAIVLAKGTSSTPLSWEITYQVDSH